jgi:hypothetical protein
MTRIVPSSGRASSRLAASLTAAALAVLGPAVAVSPAQADSASGDVITLSTINSPLQISIPSSPDDLLYIGVTRNTDGPVHDVKITADLSGIASFAGPADPSKCSGEICPVPEETTMTDKANSTTIALAAKPDAKPGSTGTVVFSGTSADGTVGSVTATVVAGKPHIVVGSLPSHATARPGGTITYPIYIGNDGSLPIQGERVTLESSSGLDFGRYSNCTASTSADPLRARRAVCDFDTTLAPDTLYKLATPLAVQVAPTALYESFDYSATMLSSPPAGGQGSSALTLVPAGTPPRNLGQQAQQYVDVSNTADFAAKGDTVTGKPGGTVHVAVSVTNRGPASVNVLDSDDQMGVMVTVPKGTETTAVPPSCAPWDIDGPAGGHKLGRPQYICAAPRPFAPGQTFSLPFTLKIGANAAAVTTGQVKATTEYGSKLAFDKDTANNTAPITVHVIGGTTAPTTGGTSGGGGASGGTGGGNAPGPQTTGGTGGGGLADTGFGGAGLAGIGAGLVVVGGGVFLALRRLRTRGGSTPA